MNSLKDLNNLTKLNDTYYKAMSEKELKEEILAIWQDVFGHTNISILDTFYELGGDSIKEIQIVSQLRNIDVQISRLDWSSTIQQLVKEISIETGKRTLDESKNLYTIGLTAFERSCRDRLFYEKKEEVA